MLIRQASGEEQLRLWGFDAQNAPPSARFFYQNLCSGNAVFWALEQDGALIGELYAFLNIEEDHDFADGQTTAYLCAFRIKKAYRGQGFGSALMDAALSDLRRRGFRRATIGVNEARNEAVYRHFGFSVKLKDCFVDPCARDAQMRPVPDPEGYRLLVKEL